MKAFNDFQSQVVMSQVYPSDRINFTKSLLIYDQALDTSKDEDLIEFINQFTHQVALPGGEDLKDFKNFPKHLDLIFQNWPEPISRHQNLVVLGGGSLGDFGGFVASIIKRGVQLIQIPSTWIAAMDSAHGGKTGLNYKGAKNQLGTFYPAKQVFVVKPLLEAVPHEIKQQSFGELIKMSLIGESQFFKELMMEKRPGVEFLWRFLPLCVEDKYQVILQDPFESKQIREVLNFGHTMGHALEVHFGWTHGDAVLQGCFFALEWSRHLQLLSQSTYEQICQVISERFDRGPAVQLKWYKKAPQKAIRKLVEADKKRDANGEVLFVFLKNIGQPVLQKVSVDDFIEEAKRQSWIK